MTVDALSFEDSAWEAMIYKSYYGIPKSKKTKGNPEDYISWRFNEGFNAHFVPLLERIFELNPSASSITIYLHGLQPWNDMTWNEGEAAAILKDSNKVELEEVTLTKTFNLFIKKHFDHGFFEKFTTDICSESNVIRNELNELTFNSDGLCELINDSEKYDDENDDYVSNPTTIKFKLIDWKV